MRRQIWKAAMSRHGINMTAWPGSVMVITPPHVHSSLLLLSSALISAMNTVGAPATQGSVVAGMHAIGVNTPSAAAVAAATIGLEGLVHIPKGVIFAIGTWSMMVAAGVPVITRLSGSTFSVAGAFPNEHFSDAPSHTWTAIRAGPTKRAYRWFANASTTPKV